MSVTFRGESRSSTYNVYLSGENDGTGIATYKVLSKPCLLTDFDGTAYIDMYIGDLPKTVGVYVKIKQTDGTYRKLEWANYPIPVSAGETLENIELQVYPDVTTKFFEDLPAEFNIWIDRWSALVESKPNWTVVY